MKHRKLIALFALLLCLTMAFGACAPADKPADSPAQSTEPNAPADTQEPITEPEPEDSSITVVDQAGREITLDEPASRIVALNPADCEILYAIGAGNTLVGRGTYCDYPAEVLEVPEVESGAETNVEQIIALEPDVLLMSTMAQTEEQTAALETAGIKVILTSDGAESIDKVYEAISLIGKVTGKDAESSALVENMKSELAAIAESVDGSFEGKTVYFEVSPLEWGLWTAGSGTFMNELAELVGLTNAFSDIVGWGEISEEQVIERNPDYIVTITMYYGEGPLPEEEIMARTGWEGITAVANQDVYNADSNAIARPGPRLVDAAKELYDFVYGE